MKLINTTCKIVQHTFSSMDQCFGCNKIGVSNKFIRFKDKNDCMSLSICVDCKDENEVSKLMICINCNKNFLLDFTQLKLNDMIQGSMYAFFCCDHCLENFDTHKTRVCWGALVHLESNKSFDTWYEEYVYDIDESKTRILGEFKINTTKEIKKNILKKIYNCREFDKKKFNNVGDITYEDIIELLKIQDNKCYICNDKVLLCN